MKPPERLERWVNGVAAPESGGALPNPQDEALAVDGADGARNAFEAQLDARYLSQAREIRTAMAELDNLLKNSGKLRLGWLKLTGQISKDPGYDLHTLNGLAEMKENYAAEERRGFEAQQAERQAQVLTREQTRMNEAGLQRTMSADEAKALVEMMEDSQVKPLPELYRRAGHGAPLQRVGDATIAGFVNDNLPHDVAPSAAEAEFGIDFDPPY